ncbi:MAG TPA: TrkA C-terminal domain-containing protein [Sedimentisphaerales bacterium]|nr:TrkA C-terminal domain-containing protein [Sedimentisphaerales bacterium]
MNLILFIIVLVISFIVVRIGAIAFQLTGLEWSLSKFQALSCFTSTGFTTKEAELVTATPQRRRIAATLIVLGHAGLVTMIATLANSLRAREVIESRLSKPILPFFSLGPFLVQLTNLVIIVAAVYVVYKVFTNTELAKKLTDALRRRIIKKEIFQRVSFEELMLATGGYGVSKINVCAGSPVLDKTLLESELRKHDIIVLAITREGQTNPNPSADTKILLGDELICFGKLENIRNRICMVS